MKAGKQAGWTTADENIAARPVSSVSSLIVLWLEASLMQALVVKIPVAPFAQPMAARSGVGGEWPDGFRCNEFALDPPTRSAHEQASLRKQLRYQPTQPYGPCTKA
jgi:hypothetical protein